MLGLSTREKQCLSKTTDLNKLQTQLAKQPRKHTVLPFLMEANWKSNPLTPLMEHSPVISHPVRLCFLVQLNSCLVHHPQNMSSLYSLVPVETAHHPRHSNQYSLAPVKAADPLSNQYSLAPVKAADPLSNQYSLALMKTLPIQYFLTVRDHYMITNTLSTHQYSQCSLTRGHYPSTHRLTSQESQAIMACFQSFLECHFSDSIHTPQTVQTTGPSIHRHTGICIIGCN